MKSNSKSPLYFSAYPLKAIPVQEPANAGNNSSPYLRSVLTAGKTKTSSRIRIFPMANPYRHDIPRQEMRRIRLAKPVSPAKEVDIPGNEWFNNYE